jgi:hypothetical protein
MIIDEMVARDYFGRTPTGPALRGALSHAGNWAANHPEDVVIAVLATDGLPSECDPQDIAQVAAIAADGLAGSPSVRTFVIGVFARADTESPANLDAIARAGGTTSALLVDATGDVTTQFTAALDAIRGAVISCEFQLPASSGGQMLDLDRVNVEIANDAEVTQLVYVESQAGCSAASGWHYDVVPSAGSRPQKNVLCPSVCDSLHARAGARVNLQIGCQTLLR